MFLFDRLRINDKRIKERGARSCFKNCYGNVRSFCTLDNKTVFILTFNNAAQSRWSKAAPFENLWNSDEVDKVFDFVFLKFVFKTFCCRFYFQWAVDFISELTAGTSFKHKENHFLGKNRKERSGHKQFLSFFLFLLTKRELPTLQCHNSWVVSLLELKTSKENTHLRQ